MNTLTELHRNAEAEGDLDAFLPEGYIRDPQGYIIPDSGFSGVVDIVAIKFGETQKGHLSMGLQLATDEGIRFWTNLYFSDNPTANQITLLELSKLGVTKEYLEADPSNDDVAEMLIGKPCKVKVTHDFGREGKIFIRASFAPAPVADTF